MGTPFSEIYARASFRFTDYDMLSMDFSQRFQILDQYLRMAEADYRKTCPFNLDNRNDEEQCYMDTLDSESIDILSLGVAYHWLDTKLMDSDKLKNEMSTKEYSFFSNANLVREMNEFRISLWKQYKQKIIDYSYYNGSFSSMKVGAK